MNRADTILFGKWQRCSREAGNHFLSYFYSRHFYKSYSSDYEEGEIPQLIARLGRDLYTSENPRIDDLIDVFYKNFANIQKKVKRGEIPAKQLISLFEYNLLCRISDYFYRTSERQQEKKKRRPPVIVSIDEEIIFGESGDTMSRSDTIPDTDAETPEEQAIEAEKLADVDRLLEEFQGCLSPQRKKLFVGLRRLQEQEGQSVISTNEAAGKLGFSGRGNIYVNKNRIYEQFVKFLKDRKVNEDREVAMELIRRVSKILALDRI